MSQYETALISSERGQVLRNGSLITGFPKKLKWYSYPETSLLVVPVSEKICPTPSDSEKLGRSLFKIVQSMSVSENCPNINNGCNVIHIYYMTSSFLAAWLSLDMRSFFSKNSTLNLSLFLKTLLGNCVFPKLSVKISCCLSEYGIGIWTVSGFRNLGFRLVPLVTSPRNNGFIKHLISSYTWSGMD